MLEYLALPECRSSTRSSRATPSVSAALYRYKPCPASSCTLAIKMALRLSVGARVIQFPSGSMPTISEWARSEEHTSELQSLMRLSYAVFCLKKKKRLQHNEE